MNNASYLHTEILSVNYETLHILPVNNLTHKSQPEEESHSSTLKQEQVNKKV